MGVGRTDAMTVGATEPEAGDGALLLRARNGDHEAFADLVRRNQRRIWLVCRQYVGPDEADAAVQETFLKAWRRLDRFDGRSAFSTWLTRIAINTCLDELRRCRRRGVPASGEDEGREPVAERIADGAADPERRAMQRQAVTRLRHAVGALPERQREIFRLRFFAELELEEIARALGVHVGTVKTQLHRAVHRIRRELEVAR